MSNQNDAGKETCGEPEGVKRVKKIPGNVALTTEFNLEGNSYAGFAGDNSKLFTWFFECKQCLHPEDAKNFPLLIWLNGGPGASSMAGVMLENGPIQMLSDQLGTIVENPYGWNKDFHIMYWDNPVGCGYSYNEEGKGGGIKYVTGEGELSLQFYEALQDFLDTLPQYRDCDLYITGESYAGKYIPAIAQRILEKNDSQKKKERIINLKGLAIGNPWFNAALQTRVRLECGFQLGFLDTKQYRTLMEQYVLLPKLIEKGMWKAAYESNQRIKKELIACGGNIAIYDVRAWDDGLLGAQMEPYFSNPEVKKALHVPVDKKWRDADEIGPVTMHLLEDYVSNTADCPEKPKKGEFVFCLPGLLEAKYKDGSPKLRILLYVGNLDMSCGFRGLEEMLYDLEWSHKEEWQALDRTVWAEPRGNTRGYYKSCANLTQIVIPHSGHLVPNSQPQVSLEMVTHFVLEGKYPHFGFPTYAPLPLKQED